METRSMTKQGITPEDMECAHILKDLHKSEVCEFNEYGISILEEERRKYISDYLLLDNMKWQIQILTLANEYGENIEKLRSMIELCHDDIQIYHHDRISKTLFLSMKNKHFYHNDKLFCHSAIIEHYIIMIELSVFHGKKRF